MKKILTTVFILAFLIPQATFGATFGETDTGSNTYPGYSVYNSGAAQTDIGNGLVLDSEGNIFATIFLGINSRDLGLQKYDANGVLDTTWGGGDGTVSYDPGGFDNIYGLILDEEDGAIYVSADGAVAGEGYNAIALKYDLNGDLDTTWGGGDGIFSYNSGGTQNDGASALALDDSNNLYVAGYSSASGSNDFYVWKLDADGELDTTWGGGDGIAIPFSSSGNDNIRGIELASDGGLLVGGSGSVTDEGTNVVLAKLDVDGVLDTTWGGGDGVVTYNSSGTRTDLTVKMFVDDDDNIYVAGYQYAVFASADAHILKFDSNGDLDATWDDDGILTYDSGGRESFEDVLLHDDGYVYVTGRTSANAGDLIIQRYDTNGDLDPDFGTAGTVTYDIGGGDNSGADLAIDENDRIVAIGYGVVDGGYDAVMWRYTPDGTLDISFGNTAVTDFPSGYILASKGVLPETGTLESVSLYGDTEIGTTTLAIYDENFDLIWESNEVVSTTSADWLTVSIADGTPTALELASDTYYLAFQLETTASVPTITDRGTEFDGFFYPQAYGAFPASLPDAILSTVSWSIYATYTPVPEPEVEEEEESSGGGSSSSHRRSSSGSSNTTPNDAASPVAFVASGSVEELMVQLVALLQQLLEQLIAERGN